MSNTPSPEQIDEICEQYDLSDEDNQLIQEFCDDFVPDVRLLHLENESIALEEAPLSKHRREANRHAKKVLDAIQWVEHLHVFRSPSYLSDEGRNALSNAAEQCLSSLIDPWFLAGKRELPTDAVPAGKNFTIEAATFGFSSRNTLARKVVKNNPDDALVWTLSAVQVTLHAFSLKLDEIAPKGGPRSRVIEPNLIMNLAFLFERMGRKPLARVLDPFFNCGQADSPIIRSSENT